MTESRWRLRAREAIRQVIREAPSDIPLGTLKKRIRLAYPFGWRKWHPYVMWLKEQRLAFQDLEKMRAWDE